MNEVLLSHANEIAATIVPFPPEFNFADVENAVEQQLKHIPEGIIGPEELSTVFRLSAERAVELHVGSLAVAS